MKSLEVVASDAFSWPLNGRYLGEIARLERRLWHLGLDLAATIV
ncbi:MAG: hypothetical protein ACO3IB_08720 [Phycisphaerales bacterium]